MSRLDADFIIPASGTFPDLPAGKDQNGNVKLAMDCEGLVYNSDGSVWISDEYGRMFMIELFNVSLRLSL